MEPDWLTDAMIEVVGRARGYTSLSDHGKNAARNVIVALAADPAFVNAVIRERARARLSADGPAWTADVLAALGITGGTDE